MVSLRREKQRVHLDILLKNGAFQFTDTFFPYTSGQIGPYYVQSGNVMRNGRDYALAIEDMASLVAVTIQGNSKDAVISGGETRDWIFSFPVAAELHIPHTMIYKDGKIVGADMNRKRIQHVADLNNEGSSPRDKWVPAIKKAGGTIENIFFYVDRMEEGAQVMRDLGLKSYSLVPLDDVAWHHLLESGEITAQVYRSLTYRMEDKDAWAREMLRSDAGFSSFVKLLRENKSKAIYIIENGYPDMAAELRERVTETESDAEELLAPFFEQ